MHAPPILRFLLKGLTFEASAIPAIEQMRLHQQPQNTMKIVTPTAMTMAADP